MQGKIVLLGLAILYLVFGANWTKDFVLSLVAVIIIVYIVFSMGIIRVSK